jgi:hypothetical protein
MSPWGSRAKFRGVQTFAWRSSEIARTVGRRSSARDPFGLENESLHSGRLRTSGLSLSFSWSIVASGWTARDFDQSSMVELEMTSHRCSGIDSTCSPWVVAIIMLMGLLSLPLR